MSTIKTAMVLAAGLGTRMRPLTNDKPKPLVRLCGKPLIEHVLGRLHDAGIKQAVVNVHYLGDMLIDHLSSYTYPSVAISDERNALLDTAGGIVNALSLIGDEPFVIHNSDSVWHEPEHAKNVSALIGSWDPERMDALLMLADGTSSVGYSGDGDFHGGPDVQPLTRRQSGEFTQDVYCGVSIMKPESFKGYDPATPMSLNAIWDGLIERNRLYGMRMQGLWMHVGDPEALARAEATPSPYPAVPA